MKQKGFSARRRARNCCLAGLICFWMVIGSGLDAQTKQPAKAGGNRQRKIRIANQDLAREISALGGQEVGDYGSYRVVRVEEGLFRELHGRPGIEDLSYQNVITLKAQPLDTSSEEVRALRQPAHAGGQKRLHLVQFAGPVKPAWLNELRQTGVEVVAYIPHNAYLVYGHGASLGQMQAWARAANYVQWEGPYRDQYKIHPRARLIDSKGNPQRPASDLYAIQLAVDGPANAASLAVIEGLKLEPIRRQGRVLNYWNVVVRLAPEAVEQIAGLPEVISIHPYREPRKRDERQSIILTGNLAGNGPAAPGYLAWLASKGFTQGQFSSSAFVVDVTDSGVDNATTEPGHFGLYLLGQTNLPPRVVYNRLEGFPNSGSTLQGCDGHGNINAHIIGGYNDLPSGFPHTDSLGYHFGLGVCPFVKVGSSVIFDPDKFTYPDYDDLISRAYNDGARVSNNSWGADTDGEYEIDSQAYDALVRDGQPDGSAVPSAGNQEMVILFAAGNAGPGVQTVGSPGSAKNVITVGAAENVRPHSTSEGGNDLFGGDGCGTSDSGADNVNDIVDFSSRGPCSDGRKKPDLVAPGTHITGGVAQSSPTPPTTGNGSALACFRASGVCALPGGGTTNNPNNFFPMGQQFYTTSSGTSHSTPAAAASAALLRQHFINLGSNPPSPALTKAFLMNSTRYMTGLDANDSLWSPNQGMGEINLGVAFDGVARSIHDQVPVQKFTASGQVRTFTGTVIDPSKPFRVTVAWTDAPGNTFGNAYNNNLDLTVTVGGKTYQGNVFNGAFSTTGGTSDPRNNVESVFLPAGVSGNFEVTVTAANINSDGVPNQAPELDQDFAIVIYNGTEINGPVIVANSYSVTTESCNPANSSIDPGEMVTISFSLKNIGNSNTVNLVGSLQATGGVSNPSGAQDYGVLVAGGAPVSQSFTFWATGGCGSLLNASLQLQDTTNLGMVTFSIPLGATAILHSQNFDSVLAPALPDGWSSSATGSQSAWTTTSAQSDSFPNAVFSATAPSVGVSELVSPIIPVSSSAGQLSFRQSYDMESGFDGGVLELKIGSGTFTDILAAGGTFVAGGYTHTLSGSYGNPLGGRQAWSGNSGEFVTTTIDLPASATSQNIQLRWRCSTDQSLAVSGWYIDNLELNGRQCCGSVVVAQPLIEGASAALQTEGCAPSNAAADPGETVTYNFGLRNIGLGNANNLVATLLSTNGVSAPGGPQVYGTLISGGATVSRPFSFAVSGTCGGTINPTFQLQDGAANLGLAAFSIQLGQFSSIFAENFDGVMPPGLPAGWFSTGGGAQGVWFTSAALKDTSPNSIFSAGASAAGTNQLISPPMVLPATSVQLNFRHNFDLESSPAGPTAYDGGVVEIRIGAGAFTDIVTAGGSFISGGYSHIISSGYQSPLAGRRCWSGNSGGFITTSLLLPPSASGQTVQLRWRCASDNSVGSSGWYVDTISVTARSCCGEITPPVASFTASPTNGASPLAVIFTDASSGTITNRFWSFGNGVTSNTTATSMGMTYSGVGTNTVSLTVSGPLGTNRLTRTNYIVVTNAIVNLAAHSMTLLAESCTNGVVDTGENITMNFGLKNNGTASTTNLVATLLAAGGITAPSGPQNYGAIAGGGASVARPFTFSPSGPCGTTNFAMLQLQDGTSNYGTVSFSFVMGQPGMVVHAQNFDGVTPPALPGGWSSSSGGSGIAWQTTASQSDSAPNSIFAPSVSSTGVADIVSAAVALPTGAVQLSFRHRFDMEAGFGFGFDAGLLEVKIGGGNFTNFTAAGGVFITNGYNSLIDTNYGNPLGGQMGWSGNSGGFVTTIGLLPAGASGQNIQLRWRCGSDGNFAGTGWFVDSVILSSYQCCANPPMIVGQPSSQTVSLGGTANFNVAATGTAPLSYQWRFYSTNLPGATGTNFSRVNVQPADAGNYTVVVSNSVNSVTSLVAVLNIVSRPVLLQPKYTNQSFQFILSGNSGYNYLIERSSNLIHWGAVTTVSNASGQVQVSDPAASNALYRYYRARLLP